jgi:hypothetical protein
MLRKQFDCSDPGWQHFAKEKELYYLFITQVIKSIAEIYNHQILTVLISEVDFLFIGS